MILGIGWVVLVGCCFVGWGRILGWALSMKCGLGETGCLGLGVVVAFGGVLNLLGLVTVVANTAIVVIGAACCIQYVFQLDPARISIPRDPLFLALAAIMISLAIVGIASYVYVFSFQPWDDIKGYLAFPAKMLTGSLGFEPFSERRLVTSLGGLYYLQSVVLTGADFHFVHSIDPSFALLLLLLLMDGAMRNRGISVVRRLGILLFILLFCPLCTNLTASLLQVPLLVFAYLAITDPGWVQARTPTQRSVCLAMTAAAIVTIKPVVIPYLVLVVAGAYLPRIVRSRNRLANRGEVALAGLLALFFVSPWMISNWQQTGTFLYPILGSGYSTATFDLAVAPLWEASPLAERLSLFVTTGLLNPPVVLLIGLWSLYCVALFRIGSPHRYRTILVSGFNVIGVLAMVLSLCLGGVGGLNLVRYLYPGAFASILIMLLDVNALCNEASHGITKIRKSVGRLSLMFIFAACIYHMDTTKQYYRDGIMNFRVLYSGPNRAHQDLFDVLRSDKAESAVAIRRLQDSVPPGQNILEHIDYPFIMDFYRNNIFIADWPGSAGPPPGWPQSKGPARLAAYLNEVSVHYIAYAYAADKLIDRHILPEISQDAWVQTDMKRWIEFQDDVAKLMLACPSMYKDRQRVVIHLIPACIKKLSEAERDRH